MRHLGIGDAQDFDFLATDPDAVTQQYVRPQNTGVVQVLDGRESVLAPHVFDPRDRFRRVHVHANLVFAGYRADGLHHVARCQRFGHRFDAHGDPAVGAAVEGLDHPFAFADGHVRCFVEDFRNRGVIDRCPPDDSAHADLFRRFGDGVVAVLVDVDVVAVVEGGCAGLDHFQFIEQRTNLRFAAHELGR